MDATVLPLSKVGALYAQIEARESSIEKVASQVAFHDAKIREQQEVFEAEINAKDERLRRVSAAEASLAARHEGALAALLRDVRVTESVCGARRAEVDAIAEDLLATVAATWERMGPEMQRASDNITAEQVAMDAAQGLMRESIAAATRLRSELAQAAELLRDAHRERTRTAEARVAAQQAIDTHTEDLVALDRVVAGLAEGIAGYVAEERDAQARSEGADAAQVELREECRAADAASAHALLTVQKEMAYHQRVCGELMAPANAALRDGEALRTSIAQQQRDIAAMRADAASEQTRIVPAQERKLFLQAAAQAALFEKMSLVSKLESLDSQLASLMDDSGELSSPHLSPDISDETLEGLQSSVAEAQAQLDAVNAKLAHRPERVRLQQLRDDAAAASKEAEAIDAASDKERAVVATLESRRDTAQQAAKDLECEMEALRLQAREDEARSAEKAAALRTRFEEAEEKATAERTVRREVEEGHAVLDREIEELEAKLAATNTEGEAQAKQRKLKFGAAQKELSAISKRVQKARRRWRRKKAEPLSSFVRAEDIEAHRQAMAKLLQI